MLVVLLFLFAANGFVSTEPTTDVEVGSSLSKTSPIEPNVDVVPVDTTSSSKNVTVKCPDNEILNTCPSYCPSDYCPTGVGQNQQCAQPNPCPPPTCKCGFNYRRAQNGTCIPTISCPPFECNKPNEEYNSCPPYCPTDSCSQATPTGECPLPGRILIVLECRPTCRCKKGFWRLDNGTCVPYLQCPGKLTCGPNEVVDNCPVDCKADYCPTDGEPEQPCPDKPCDCPPPACKCAFNYRRAENGTCIPRRDCPIKLKCPPGDIVNECPLFCNTDYCPKDENDVRYCSIPFICPGPACKCPFNHLRAANGTCIPASDCPPILCTRPHEVFNDCPPACPTDDCREATPTGECPYPGNIDTVVECRPGCRCEKNYWRKNGTCVPYEQCGK